MKKLKQMLALLLAVCCLALAAPAIFAADPSDAISFVDVKEGAYYYNSVGYCARNGIMTGMADDVFGPDVPMTRAMLVTTLYRIEGEPAVGASTPFTDVGEGQYYTNPVAWAYQNEIVNGITDTTFNPNGNITREQLCTMMIRYANYKGYVSASGTWEGMSSSWLIVSETLEAMFDMVEMELLDPYTPSELYEDALTSKAFADTLAIGDWALDAVYTCAAAGIVKGMTPTEFVPQGNATRAQVATVLQRFMHAMTTEVETVEEDGVSTVVYSDAFGVYGSEVTTYDGERPVSCVYSDDTDYSYQETYYVKEDSGNNLDVTAYSDSDGVHYKLTVDPVNGTTEYDNYGDLIITTQYDVETMRTLEVTVAVFECEGDVRDCYYTTEYDFSYDDEGRLTEKTETVTDLYNCEYGEEPLTYSLSYAYQYDDDGRVVAIVPASDDEMTDGSVSFEYFESGLLKSFSMSDGGDGEMMRFAREEDGSKYYVSMALTEEMMIEIVLDQATDSMTLTSDGESQTVALKDLLSGNLFQPIDPDFDPDLYPDFDFE